MKTLLVTGGSRGIGKAIVKTFAKSRWTVAYCYSNNDADADLLDAEVPHLMRYKADVSVFADVESMITDITAKTGGIDLLINNAGVSCIKLITEMTEIEWQRILSVNLTGPFNCCRAVLPQMIHRGEGQIINIGSMWGTTGASCEVAYSATKAGLAGMTKALAKEVGPSGIRVNCIAPGVIDTEMNRCLSAAAIDALADETPLGCIGTPEDVAQCALYLAESRFVTGQIIGVDGGMAV
jgi:3-oxoacyl-[acyl-carrier protein] reductase